MVLTLWPHDHIFLATIEEDVIILDVEQDAYACFPDGGLAIQISSDGSLMVKDVELAEELRAAGIATTSPPSSSRKSIVPAATALQSAVSPSRLGVVLAALDIANAGRAFGGQTLQQLVKRAAIHTPEPSRGSPTEIARHLGDFTTALPWIPFEGECLKRSFQLRHLLARRGVASDWVFGVRTWPFGAHCWLQIEETVVGDTLARVSNYTPIMVV